MFSYPLPEEMTRTAPLVLFLLFALSGCQKSAEPLVFVDHGQQAAAAPAAAEREAFHQVSVSIQTPMAAGVLRQYLMLGSEVSLLDTRPFDGEIRSHIGFNAPVSSSGSVLLLHLTAAAHTTPSALEFVCFVAIEHDTFRHSREVECDHFTTVTYYLAATRIGRSNEHPFHDIVGRFAAWESLVASPENNLTGFYASAFGTLQNALLGMGDQHFDPARFSIRPVMETIVARFFETYQREGRVTASELVTIANQVTDHTMPLERLVRFQTVFQRFAYVADVKLEATGGTLTQRGTQVELLSMSNELTRFFLRESPLAMSDYRTRVVQAIQHEHAGGRLQVRWDPIAHMYGYNVYLDGEQVGFTRLPAINLPSIQSGTLTIKAVGYGGEFDGV
ncbi:MAG TPA: hypothetical protein PLV87_12630, partial [Opitutaceae bacterium]|nr:hypothetical protein [Opitutaceae bacterium]